VRAIIIISIDEQVSANNLCATIVEGGENTFTVGLSSKGSEPITHYWCNWDMKQEQYDVIKAEFENVFEIPVWTPEGVLQEMALKQLDFDGD